MPFNYIIINTTTPCVIVGKFVEGTKVNITKVITGGIVEVTNGQDLQVCSITQLKRITR